MPIALRFRPETRAVSTRPVIVRCCPNQAAQHTNLRAPRIYGRPTLRSSVKQIRRPQARQHQISRTASWSSPRHSLLQHRQHTTADSTKAYAHAAGSHPTRHSNIPQLRPQNDLPARAAQDVPTSYCAQLLPLQLSRARRNSRHRECSRTRTTPLAAAGAPRWPKASAWDCAQHGQKEEGESPFGVG